MSSSLREEGALWVVQAPARIKSLDGKHLGVPRESSSDSFVLHVMPVRALGEAARSYGLLISARAAAYTFPVRLYLGRI